VGLAHSVETRRNRYMGKDMLGNKWKSQRGLKFFGSRVYGKSKTFLHEGSRGTTFYKFRRASLNASCLGKERTLGKKEPSRTSAKIAFWTS